MTAPVSAEGATCAVTYKHSDRACGWPATETITSTCVHGHTRRGLMCESDAVQAKRGSIQQCAECWDGPGRHSCALTVAHAEPLDGTVRTDNPGGD